MKWLLAVLIVIGIGFAGFTKWRSDRAYAYKWGPIVMPDRVAQIIKPMSVEKLGERLEETKKIRDADAFIEAAREAKLTTIAPGGYGLPATAGPRDLVKVFLQKPNYVKITFPEGFTGLQMADRLKRNGVQAADAFRQLVYPPGKTVSPLEGKLFPDTYYVRINGSAKEIVDMMIARYKEVRGGIATADKLKPRGLGGKPLSDEQILILASLVERETDIADERPLVAGVLAGRLQKKMRLQCDASVQYARVLAEAQGQLNEGHKERLLLSDLQMKSPYNTYRNNGLPPAPICNPSKSSIRAALEPRNTPYVFYVMSPKLKRHRFAKTFEEHIHNKNLAAQEARALGS